MSIEQQYQTENLMKRNEVQLKSLAEKFRKENFPFWKIGAFALYNITFFSGLVLYTKKMVGKRKRSAFIDKKQVSIGKIISRGTIHATFVTSIYVIGMGLLISNLFPFNLLLKFLQIQSTQQSFSLRFDSGYQEDFLFSKMRHFDISQTLINQIKEELKEQRQKVIEQGGLSKNTIKKLQQADKEFQSLLMKENSKNDIK